MTWFKRVLLLLVVLAALTAVGAGLYVQRALPTVDGTITLAGASAEVRIERDANGVPTVHASNLNDAAFAVGVLHAQDRLWQLETHKRIGSGRLAEAFGEAALDSDRFLRALAVRRAAALQWQQMSGPSRELLMAYTRGINAVLKDELRARPPEFIVLGLQPEEWSPVDSMAWAIMMAWDLGGNWTTELLRMRLALQMPVQRVNELLPPYPGDKPMPSMDYASFYRSLKLPGATQTAWLNLPAIAPESGVEGVGSNNWVVAGSHTNTGKPLLANDPHLKLSAPALWYFVRIQTPQGKVAGATMPGFPTIVLGQNEHLAWGFTNTGPDVQDLYIEQIKADDDSMYRTPDGWAAFETAQEVIKVKGKPDVNITVRSTRHGPVISDAGLVNDLLGTGGKTSHVLALRWTALDKDIDPMASGLAMVSARTVAEFTVASRLWTVPMQNMVVADTAGAIGMVSPGRVPVRKAENDLHGLAPAPGWDARYDWAGWVPLDETPREFNPERGYIASANQRIHAADYPHFIGSDWALPFRQVRIEQMLGGRAKHSIDDLAAMQADVKSLAAVQMLPWLRKANSTHALAEQARPLLAAFDGNMRADKAEPLIFWAWMRHLGAAVLADDLGPALWDKTVGRTWVDALEGVLSRNDSTWCDDRKTPAVVETCQDNINLALTRALDELQSRFGSDMATWRWGTAHQARAEHRPFSRVKPLAKWFELRVPVGGDSFTVNVGKVGLRPDATTGELYIDEHGPSLRALYDLADIKQSRFMYSSGQSGLVFSAHYRNFLQPWAEVRYEPLWPTSAPAHTLTIQPKLAP